MLLGLFLAMTIQAGPVTTLARDAMSQVEEPRQVVARTGAELGRLWREHGAGTPAPAVDFTTRTVVAVFLGTRPSAGYAVEITGTRRDGAALVVEWRERRPDPGDIVAQVLTSPAHIASIPSFAGEIRFEKLER